MKGTLLLMEKYTSDNSQGIRSNLTNLSSCNSSFKLSRPGVVITIMCGPLSNSFPSYSPCVLHSLHYLAEISEVSEKKSHHSLKEKARSSNLCTTVVLISRGTLFPSTVWSMGLTTQKTVVCTCTGVSACIGISWRGGRPGKRRKSSNTKSYNRGFNLVS